MTGNTETRDGKLSRMADIASETAQVQAGLRAELEELRDVLTGKLPGMLAQEARWQALRSEWMRLAADLGQPVGKGENIGQADALYQELRDRGVNVDALLAQRWHLPDVWRSREDAPLGHLARPDVLTPFGDRVPFLLLNLYVAAWNAWTETQHNARRYGR